MNRFLLLEPFHTGSTYFLSEEESHHLKNVVRLKPNDEITVLDGKGAVGVARVCVLAKHCKVELLKISEHSASSRVSLAFGLSKSNALDFIFHRATELGVRSFWPLVTQHSVTHKHWHHSRWEKIVHEACKQCEENVFPTIHPPMQLEHWLEEPSATDFFYCDEMQRQVPAHLKSNTSNVSLLIGPEGGFAKEEVERIKKRGGIPMGLGANRLRTETAALVALALLKKVAGEIP